MSPGECKKKGHMNEPILLWGCDGELLVSLFIKKSTYSPDNAQFTLTEKRKRVFPPLIVFVLF